MVDTVRTVILSIVGAVIIIMLALQFYWGQNLPFIFSRRNPPSTDVELQDMDLEAQRPKSLVSVEGEYTQYGELFVAPNQKPTSVALDIITRMLMCIGLPASAVAASPHLSLHFEPGFSVPLPDPDTFEVMDSPVLAEPQAALLIGRRSPAVMDEAMAWWREDDCHAPMGIPVIDIIAATPRQSDVETLRESNEAVQQVAAAANKLLARNVHGVAAIMHAVLHERSGEAMMRLYRK